MAEREPQDEQPPDDFPPTPTVEQRPDAHPGGRGIEGETCAEGFLLGDITLPQTGGAGVVLVAPLLHTQLCQSCARQLGWALVERGARDDAGTARASVLITEFTRLLEAIGAKTGA